MELTLEGMVTDVSEVQSENANIPILVTLFGRFKGVSEVHKENRLLFLEGLDLVLEPFVSLIQ
jgi:hypothetical protein